MRGKRVVGTDNRCLIVMYHYVRPLPQPDLPFFKAITPDQLKKQIESLSKEWTFVSLIDYVDGLLEKRKLPKNCCILSFDDGLRDHYEFVLPILSYFGISGAFFVSSLSISKSFLFDVHVIQHLVARFSSEILTMRLNHAIRLISPDDADRLLASNHQEKADQVYYYETDPLRRRAKYIMNFALPEPLRRDVALFMFREEFGREEDFAHRLYLTPIQLRRMSDKGMTIGSHGHRHIAMSFCDIEQKKEELNLSRQLIESWISRSVWAFCYPWGGTQHIDSESETSLIKQGYRCGLTTLDGINELEVSPFYLRRRDCIRVPLEA